MDSPFEAIDERFRRLHIPTARLDTLYSGCRWAEGPAYFPAGRYLVWSDIPNNRMLRYDECCGTISVFRHPSNHSNGNTTDRAGRLVSCEHGGRRVSRTEFDGTVITIAARHRGKRLNSPNDVVVKSDGSIWFTDPTYGIDSDYEGNRGASEQAGRGTTIFISARRRRSTASGFPSTACISSETETHQHCLIGRYSPDARFCWNVVQRINIACPVYLSTSVNPPFSCNRIFPERIACSQATVG